MLTLPVVLVVHADVVQVDGLRLLTGAAVIEGAKDGQTIIKDQATASA